MKDPNFTSYADRNILNLNSFTKSISKLARDSELFQKAYVCGQPYSHLVIDNLFDSEILDRIVAEFPQSGNRESINWDIDSQGKTKSLGINGLSIFSQLFLFWLNSSEFINELKQLVGIKNLVPDPLFFGSGLHEVFEGGYLERHAERTKHPVLPLNRSINLIIYLNRDWNPAWESNIELEDRTNPKRKVGYAPYFNRTLIVPTTSAALHGASHLLLYPQEYRCKFLSSYYWSPNLPWRIIRKVEKIYQNVI